MVQGHTGAYRKWVLPYQSRADSKGGCSLLPMGAGK